MKWIPSVALLLFTVALGAAEHEAPAPAADAVIELDAKAEAALKKEVEGLTRDYLALLDKEKFVDAYNLQSDAAKQAFTIDNWIAKRKQEHARAGERESLDIWRLTVYRNPQDAPGPGNYVAADYDSEFELLPVVCGYVMWHQDPAGELTVMRHEMGYLDASMLESIPDGQVSEIKQQIGCKS